MELAQSTFSRGNCLDNAPSNRFLVTLKIDDLEFKQVTSLAELQELVNEDMEHYNGTRKQ